jgi:hypothetical protein
MTIGFVRNHAVQVQGERGASDILLSNLRILDTYEQMVKIQPGEREELVINLEAIPGTLKIHSEPAGAKIFVNNQYQGEAKAGIVLKDLKPGTYRVRAQMKGYEVLARNVTVGHGETRSELFGLSRNSGIMEIATAPAGVRVFVDGEDRGVTKAGDTDRVSVPMKVELLEVGEHKIQLTKAGWFAQEFKIEIKLYETTTVQKILKRKFIPDREIRTATEVIVGVYHGKDANDNHVIEPRPGIVRRIPDRDVRVIRALKQR